MDGEVCDVALGVHAAGGGRDLEAAAEGLERVVRLEVPPVALNGPVHAVKQLVHTVVHPLDTVVELRARPMGGNGIWDRSDIFFVVCVCVPRRGRQERGDKKKYREAGGLAALTRGRLAEILSAPKRLARWIFIQRRPLGPRGWPSAKTRRPRLRSEPRWFRWGGMG